MLKGSKLELRPKVWKQLLFAEVICNHIKEKIKKQKSSEKKRHFGDCVIGKVEKKYKFVEYLTSLTSITKEVLQKDVLQKRNDESYKRCSGMIRERRLQLDERETITRRKVKQEKDC